MHQLTVPTLNSNDDSYILVEWLVDASQWVDKDQPIAVVETSKATNELVAGEAGFITQLVTAGAPCRPGQAIGWLHPEAAAATEATNGQPYLAATDPQEETAAEQSQPSVTHAARELMDQHGVPWSAVLALGKPLIRQSDILDLLSSGKSELTEELSAHQRAVAQRVTQSHATIPAAFTVVKIWVDELTLYREQVSERLKAFIGIPELVIKAVAQLNSSHPRCFASVHDNLRLELSETTNIGVTIDVGTGLYVPVIRDAANLDVQDIAAKLMNLRLRAARRSLSEGDLAGGQLTISLQMDNDTVLGQPIIFPGQPCSLSLPSVQEQLSLGSDGTLISRHYVNLGMAYDHRILNGRDATIFLGALKTSLEHPQRKDVT